MVANITHDEAAATFSLGYATETAITCLAGGNVGIGKSPATILDVNGVINAVTGFKVNNALATVGHFLRGDGANFVDGTLQAADLPGGFSGFANPTASLGLTAVNGSATTAMRSDGAPALDVGIVPTWTGLHTFKITDAVTNATSVLAVIAHNSTGTPTTGFGSQISFQLESTTTPDRAAAELNVKWTTATDATRASKMGFSVVTGAGAPTEYMSLTPYLLDVTGTVNVSSGFQIGATATNGNVLRGNGTSFVSATLAATDLSGILAVAHGGTGFDFTAASDGVLVLAGGSIGYRPNTALVGPVFCDAASGIQSIGFGVSGQTLKTTGSALIWA